MNSNHQISLDDAITMTKRYRDNQPGNAPICETFEAEVISALLSVPGCTFLRIYYGMDAENEIHAILVAADDQNADILPLVSSAATAAANAGSSGGILLEDGYRCPQDCPPPSKLNS